MRTVASVVPGVSGALLAVVGCPACWPAYLGLVSSLGLGVVTSTAVLVPLTVSLLAVALTALLYRADRRRGLRPFGLGLVGAAVVLYGRLGLASDPVVLAGAVLLIAASIWNGLPRRTSACPECAPIRRYLS